MLVGLVSAAAESPKEKERLLVGTWEVRSSAVKGVDYPSEVGKRLTFSAKGRVIRSGGDEDIVITFKLNPNAKPYHIDFVLTNEKDKSVLVVKGVYRLTGDVLEICAGTPEDERPKTISKRENGYQLLKRVTSSK
jgi:uncharacterized protein (TIGR03067 family)